ncbi:MAG: hypothetical protein HZB16_09240 [Armatimonadetes bacterium]|nr:hypothetical protein [Armatimonadota bacterium]
MDPLVDLTEVRRLIEIVERHGLEGLSVTEDDAEVSITSVPSARPVAGALVAAGAGPGGEAVEDTSHLLRLRSPITGVFYRSPSPSEPVFVQVGDVVEPDDVACLIEAMKIFNEIPVGFHGRLSRVVAANEQLVVTGEVLMEFEPLEDVG